MRPKAKCKGSFVNDWPQLSLPGIVPGNGNSTTDVLLRECVRCRLAQSVGRYSEENGTVEILKMKGKMLHSMGKEL